jgi:hypothetical protein
VNDAALYSDAETEARKGGNPVSEESIATPGPAGLTMDGFAISLTLGISYCLKAMRGEWAGDPIIGRWADKIVRT